jgi:hypothetical protein
VQRDEEQLVIDCQQYCLEHLINRVYEPETGREGAGMPAGAAGPERAGMPASPAGRPSRMSR